jgi:hypothetical protein
MGWNSTNLGVLRWQNLAKFIDCSYARLEDPHTTFIFLFYCLFMGRKGLPPDTVDFWVGLLSACLSSGECSSIRDFLKKHPACPVSRSSLHEGLQRRRSGSPRKPQGRPPALDIEIEARVVEAVKVLQTKYTHVSNQMIIRELAALAATPRPDEPDGTIAVSRVIKVVNPGYVRGFKQRNNLSGHYHKAKLACVMV